MGPSTINMKDLFQTVKSGISYLKLGRVSGRAPPFQTMQLAICSIMKDIFSSYSTTYPFNCLFGTQELLARQAGHSRFCETIWMALSEDLQEKAEVINKLMNAKCLQNSPGYTGSVQKACIGLIAQKHRGEEGKE